MGAIFLGSPAAAVPSLAALIDVADVDLVVTQPDRPRGRSGAPVAPAVKRAAAEWGLRVAQPSTADELYEDLAAVTFDVGVVAAFGRILEQRALALPPYGFVNVHFSLLPRWRGAAPVERAILAGDESTGVSLMLVDEGLDTGPVLAAIETPIADDETGGTLTGRLSYLGAMLVDDALPEYLAGRVDPAPQIDTGATKAARLSKGEARIDGTWAAEDVLRAVRAFNPRPGAWMVVDGVRHKVLSAAASDARVDSGTVEAVDGVPIGGFTDGSVALTVLQPAGKDPQSGADWLNGRRGVGGSIEEA
jgi:methionyl-tRNA formyltransferase